MPQSAAPIVPRRFLLKSVLPAAAALAGCASQSGSRRTRPGRPADAARLVLELKRAPAESLVAALRRARETGYQTVLLPARDDADAAVTLAGVRSSNLRWAVEMSGCTPLGVYAPLDGLPRGSLVDRGARADGGALLALRDGIELCAAIGGRVVLLGGGAQRADLSGGAAADAGARLAKRLMTAAAWAAERNVELLLDPQPRTETNLINTAAEAIELVRRIDHPALGVALAGRDLGAPGAREALSGQIGRVKLVRLQEDAEQFSSARLDDLRGTLHDANYGGWLSVPDGAAAASMRLALL